MPELPDVAVYIEALEARVRGADFSPTAGEVHGFGVAGPAPLPDRASRLCRK